MSKSIYTKINKQHPNTIANVRCVNGRGTLLRSATLVTWRQEELTSSLQRSWQSYSFPFRILPVLFIQNLTPVNSKLKSCQDFSFLCAGLHEMKKVTVLEMCSWSAYELEFFKIGRETPRPHLIHWVTFKGRHRDSSVAALTSLFCCNVLQKVILDCLVDEKFKERIAVERLKSFENLPQLPPSFTSQEVCVYSPLAIPIIYIDTPDTELSYWGHLELERTCLFFKKRFF